MPSTVASQAAIAASAPTTEAGWETLASAVIPTLPSLLLVLLTVFAVYYLRTDFRRVAAAFAHRLEEGSSVKIGSFELGDIRVSATPAQPSGDHVASFVDRERSELRESIYKSSDSLFMAHRLFPSNVPGQTYDVWVYLVGHKRNLDGVINVEYFMGPAWGNQVFVSSDRGKRFGVLASAYGSGFLCLARISTSGGRIFDIHRYIDFEAGVLGKE